MLRRPGSSWGFGALLKGLTSVVVSKVLTCCQTSCLLCHLAVNCSLIICQGSLSLSTCTAVTWAKGVFSFTPLNIWNTTQYLNNGHYPVACGDPSGKVELYSHYYPFRLLYCLKTRHLGELFVFRYMLPSLSTIWKLIKYRFFTCQ